MISNLNGSGLVPVHRKKAVFTGSRFRFDSLLKTVTKKLKTMFSVIMAVCFLLTHVNLTILNLALYCVIFNIPFDVLCNVLSQCHEQPQTRLSCHLGTSVRWS